LAGKKLRGEWYLVRLRGGDEWLLIKGGEDMEPVSAKADDTSVRSGKSMKALSDAAGRVWQSNRAEPRTFKARMAELARATATKKKAPRASRSRGAKKPVSEGRAGPPGSPKSTKTTARGKRTQSSGSAAATHASETNDSGEGGGRRGPAPPPKRTKIGKKPTANRSARTPEFIEPMKAQLVDSPPTGDWVYEIKFDGFRAIAFRDDDGTRLLSRNNKDFAGRFPEVVEAIAALDVADAVIDGEIVALDEKGRSSFQLLQAYDLGQKRPPIFFYAFDLLQLNGRDLQALPLNERKAELEKLLKDQNGVIRYSVSLGNNADVLLKQARELGLEGLIGKRPESTYEAGRRSGNWIKLKLNHEQEFVIGGYTPPGGSRQHFGALLVGVYDGRELKFAGKVGTGFNTKLLRSLHAEFKKIERPTCPFVDLPEKRSGRYGQGVTAAEMKRCHWLEPTMVCQLRFTEWTRDDRLRHPVFLGIREDKSATDVVRENKG